MAGILRTGLAAAGSPETALDVCASLTWQVAAVIGVVAVVPAVIALAVQAVQAGPRGEHRQSQAGALPASQAPGGTSVGGELRRALLMVALAAVAVGATVRAAVLSGTELAITARPLAAAGHVAWTVGGPLALLVLAAAALDTLLRRADWHAAAWMSRREMEEEVRETEGHPLTRERRASRRRRRNA